MAGTRLFSERADMNRTINCGTPMKGRPTARKLRIPTSATVLFPSGPHGVQQTRVLAVKSGEHRGPATRGVDRDQGHDDQPQQHQDSLEQVGPRNRLVTPDQGIEDDDTRTHQDAA